MRSQPTLFGTKTMRRGPIQVAFLISVASAFFLLILTARRLGCSSEVASPVPRTSSISKAGIARAIGNAPSPTRSLCSAAALRRRYLLEPDRLPVGLPGIASEPLHLTFATASVDELLTNWAAHARQLQLHAIVAAMDRVVLERCPHLRVRCLASLDASMDAAMIAEARKHRASAADVNIRGNPTLFISLGARKVAAILLLLERSGRPVVVSDVDVVWLRDPSALVLGRLAGYEDFAHADLLASTDCLDPVQDVADHGCFHVLQDRNTGVLLVRNTSAALGAMREWRDRTAGAFQAWETDQTAFDDLLRGRGRGHRRNMTQAQRQEHSAFKRSWCGLPATMIEAETMGVLSELDGRHVAGSRRLFDVCIPRVARTLRFGLLPLALVANGHSFFVQQLQLQTGVWPMAVHATYQFEDAVDCAFGKRERMREWGLWLADGASAGGSGVGGDEGGAAGGAVGERVAHEGDDGADDDAQDDAQDDARGSDEENDACAGGPGTVTAVSATAAAELEAGERFLVLTDEADADALPPVAAWDERDPHARGRQHVAHLERFRQRLAIGVLLARALNRTVVLPPFYCYCDRYWARLTRCTVGHQAAPTQPLPFRCPMDHVVPIGGWHGKYEARRARGRRCELPGRADGRPEEGMPYRTHGWLRAAHEAGPPFASFGGTLVPHDENAVGAMGAARAATVPPVHGAELVDGALLRLPAASSDAKLREALRSSGWDTRPLLRVSLEDARKLLGCVVHVPPAQALLLQLFRFRWCWRPEEMTEPRYDAATNTTTDVCVWGLPTPAAPKRCSGEPSKTSAE